MEELPTPAVVIILLLLTALIFWASKNAGKLYEEIDEDDFD